MSDEEEVFDAVVYYSANATFRLTEQDIREQRGLLDPRIRIVIQHIVLPNVQNVNECNNKNKINKKNENKKESKN